MLGDLRVNQFAPVGLELGERTLLVSAHETAIASHIGRQDGCEPPLYSLSGQGCAPGWVEGSLRAPQGSIGS